MNIPKDKLLHFIVGFLIGLGGGILGLLLFGDMGFLVGAAGAFLAGVAKEIKDKKSYGKFDPVDLIATVGGGLLGSGLAALIY